MEPALRVTEIQRYVERQPFCPFRICMSDGTTHEVTNPNLVFVTRRTVFLGVLRGDEVIPDDTKHCDPLHITRVETMDPESPEPEPPAA